MTRDHSPGRASVMESPPFRRHHAASLSPLVCAAALGCVAWGLPFAYESQTLSKISEELLAVNETVHSNVNQFSLVPFTEDSNEYRDAVESWSAHFKEVCNMARQAIDGPIEDVAPPYHFLVVSSVWAAACISLITSLLLRWHRHPPALYVSAACVVYIVTAVVSVWPQLRLILSINAGIDLILRDVTGRGGVMEALLARSNANDEFLDLMLLTTGYLRQVDEEPPWLCLPLPWPLHGLRHQTISARPLGYAEVGAGRARSWMDSKVRVRLKTE